MSAKLTDKQKIETMSCKVCRLRPMCSALREVKKIDKNINMNFEDDKIDNRRGVRFYIPRDYNYSSHDADSMLARNCQFYNPYKLKVLLEAEKGAEQFTITSVTSIPDGPALYDKNFIIEEKK